MPHVFTALLRATVAASQTAGSISSKPQQQFHNCTEWQYHVRFDEKMTGVASPVVAGADGAIYFGTFSCVYSSSMCVNATGELVKLDAETGGEEWSVRFAGAGLTGAMGFPEAPVIVGEPSGNDFRAIVVGAETLNSGDGIFYYFAGSVPLNGDSVSCDVPLVSGNRHEVAVSTAAECESAGGCWAAEKEDMCALSETAQTTACDDVDNPEDEEVCTSKGCCFNGHYSRGWCFRASPSCFRPAPAAHSLQQTARPGPAWMSKPVPSERGHLVVMVDCISEMLGVPSECGLGAYKSEGGPSLWRVPLAASCDDGGTAPCMCSVVTSRLPPPVVSQDAVYAVACSSEGVVLLGFSLETGEALWPLQLLGSYLIDDVSTDDVPPSPVWSSDHSMIYAAIFLTRDVAKILAHSASSGEMVWSTEVSGHSCALGFCWLETAVVSGDMVLLWDNYTLRALHASSGLAMWQTSPSDFAVVLGSSVPTMLPDSVLVPISYQNPSCDAMLEDNFFIAEISLSDGTLRRRAASPEGIIPAQVTNPVSAGGLWVFSSTEGHPRKSTIFAIKPPAIDCPRGQRPNDRGDGCVAESRGLGAGVVVGAILVAAAVAAVVSGVVWHLRKSARRDQALIAPSTSPLSMSLQVIS